jgi:hypothetical protein
LTFYFYLAIYSFFFPSIRSCMGWFSTWAVVLLCFLGL